MQRYYKQWRERELNLFSTQCTSMPTLRLHLTINTKREKKLYEYTFLVKYWKKNKSWMEWTQWQYYFKSCSSHQINRMSNITFLMFSSFFSLSISCSNILLPSLLFLMIVYHGIHTRVNIILSFLVLTKDHLKPLISVGS